MVIILGIADTASCAYKQLVPRPKIKKEMSSSAKGWHFDQSVVVTLLCLCPRIKLAERAATVLVAITAATGTHIMSTARAATISTAKFVEC